MYHISYDERIEEGMWYKSSPLDVLRVFYEIGMDVPFSCSLSVLHMTLSGEFRISNQVTGDWSVAIYESIVLESFILSIGVSVFVHIQCIRHFFVSTKSSVYFMSGRGFCSSRFLDY